MGEINMYNIWLEYLKKPLRRPRRRWEDNIRMGVREVGWEVVDWIHLAQDTNNYGLVDMIMNPWVL
jgi:hypothetical protein